MTAFQRAELALKLKSKVEAKAKERKMSTLKQNMSDVQISAPRSKSRDELASIAGNEVAAVTAATTTIKAIPKSGDTLDVANPFIFDRVGVTKRYPIDGRNQIPTLTLSQT